MDITSVVVGDEVAYEQAINKVIGYNESLPISMKLDGIPTIDGNDNEVNAIFFYPICYRVESLDSVYYIPKVYNQNDTLVSDGIYEVRKVLFDETNNL